MIVMLEIIKWIKSINTNNSLKHFIRSLGFDKTLVRMKSKENWIIFGKLTNT